MAVLNGCFYGLSRRAIANGNAVTYVTETVVRVPESKDYLEPAAFYALPDKTGYFTLAPGDVIVRGAVDDGIPANKSDRDILQKYKGQSFRVASAKNNCLPGLRTSHYVGRDM